MCVLVCDCACESKVLSTLVKETEKAQVESVVAGMVGEETAEVEVFL